jgi:hypothetical protein
MCVLLQLEGYIVSLFVFYGNEKVEQVTPK